MRRKAENALHRSEGESNSSLREGKLDEQSAAGGRYSRSCPSMSVSLPWGCWRLATRVRLLLVRTLEKYRSLSR